MVEVERTEGRVRRKKKPLYALSHLRDTPASPTHQGGAKGAFSQPRRAPPPVRPSHLEFSLRRVLPTVLEALAQPLPQVNRQSGRVAFTHCPATADLIAVQAELIPSGRDTCHNTAKKRGPRTGNTPEGIPWIPRALKRGLERESCTQNCGRLPARRGVVRAHTHTRTHANTDKGAAGRSGTGV